MSPDLLYPTEADLRGPWLLDAEALRELDHILEQEKGALESRRLGLIQEHADDKVKSWQQSPLRKYEEDPRRAAAKVRKAAMASPQYPLGLSHATLALDLPSRATYYCESFAEPIKDNSLLDTTAVGFALNITSADIQCRVRLSEHLSIAVTPSDSQVAQQLFTSLRNWAVSHQAPMWQQLWSMVRGWHWLIWIMLLSVAIGLLPTKSDLTKQAASAVAHQLLQGGITEAEVPSALEFLMRTSIEDFPDLPKYQAPIWFRVLTFGGFAACILLTFLPRTLIGIGSGDTRIRAWRVWITLVGITIPSLVFASFIWPAAQRFIEGLFR